MSLFSIWQCTLTKQAWIMTGLFLINPRKWVCSCTEIDVIALMMGLISQQSLQPSLNHWAWMIMSILHLEHLSQWAGLEAAGVLMISYPLIKPVCVWSIKVGACLRQGRWSSWFWLIPSDERATTNTPDPLLYLMIYRWGSPWSEDEAIDYLQISLCVYVHEINMNLFRHPVTKRALLVCCFGNSLIMAGLSVSEAM